MKRSIFAAGFAALLAAGSVAFGASLFPNFPIVGGATYCASNTVAGVPGTAAQPCVNQVPAGPTTYTGNEQVLAGIGSGGTGAGGAASNVAIPGQALSLGARVDQTAVASATIPALTPYYFLDSAQGSAFTTTMPAAPLDGYVQHIFCTLATVGVQTVAANTGQTLKNNPNAACTAGVGYAWIYSAANTTWYRFQ